MVCVISPVEVSPKEARHTFIFQNVHADAHNNAKKYTRGIKQNVATPNTPSQLQHEKTSKGKGPEGKGPEGKAPKGKGLKGKGPAILLPMVGSR